MILMMNRLRIIFLVWGLLALVVGWFLCVEKTFADDTPPASTTSKTEKKSKNPAKKKDTKKKDAVEPNAFNGSISHTDVFRSGKDGCHTYRIPAVVCTKEGTLLAFAEGRKDSRSDSGNIDVVLRRSTDNGKTWDPMQVVADNGEGVVGNPCPVVDAESGDIVLVTVHQTPGATQRSVRSGEPDHKRIYFVQRSSDDGKTWSEPKPIRVTDRLQPCWLAGGPGHAIQLQRGDHKGRILVVGNHSTGKGFETNVLHVIYSDNGGQTWTLGAIRPASETVWPSEAMAAELSDGTIYFTIRDQNGNKSSPSTRAFGRSRDGGESFDGPLQLASQMTAPVCQGCILEFSATDRGDDKDCLVVSYPNDAKERKNLCVRCSTDCGKTWSECRTIYADSSAYSDLVRTTDGCLGVLYERDNSGRITFAVVK